ncbi:bestrophin family ion channel [Shimia sp. R9_3]|uniref:bestrophin family protein n=1 Tax=Shimia sp. R9_3 TaxID=2821113 RepID=UPI001ADC748E|nr:bestrophin family ion channel [Shimia sp. R9_3]MBO9403380.1 hypothetical protein [Shimia sp. R9_3]
MIVRPQPSAMQLFFVLRGSILSKIYGKILLFAVWASAIDLLSYQTDLLPKPSISSMSVFGVALTLFLAFRNTVVFDRWWEARKLWGGIVASVRAASQESLIHLNSDQDRQRFLLPVARFFHAHRANLRGEAEDTFPEYANLVNDDAATSTNPAAYWLNTAARNLNMLSAEGNIDPMGRLSLSNRLSDLAAQQAGNERIKTTPVPFVYSLLVRRTTYVYCAFLPFALADSGGVFAPAIMAVVAYVFFGLQAVTRELEDPFTSPDNGLPLNAICRVCDNTILETFGLPTLPASEPADYILT